MSKQKRAIAEDPHLLAERIVDHYERHAANWSADRAATPDLESVWLDRVVENLPVGNNTILDLGCGPGVRVARHMIGRGLRVTGIDSSSSMIARCKAQFPEQKWVLGDMRTTALGREFAGVLAWDSFFHLAPSAQRRMFAMFRAHLAPGGILLFNSGPNETVAIGSYRGDALYHASLGPDEYRALFASNGLEEIAFKPYDSEAGGRSVWLARRCLGANAD